MIRTMIFACMLAVAVPAVSQAQVTTLYDIPGINDGSSPQAGLLKFGGKLYGTTSGGGAFFSGTVFSVDPVSGKETVVYTFTGGGDGAAPTGPLITVDGKLYGTTAAGGAGVGTVFALDPATGVETVIYTFPAAGENGNPQGALLHYDGYMFGTSEFGGSEDSGYVYSIDLATNAFSIVYSFKDAMNGSDDGGFPVSGLTLHGKLLYGTAELGGKFGVGTLYQLDPATGDEKTLHSFGSGGTDGQVPVASPIDVDGILYGTTTGGGSGASGTVFGFDLATHTATTLYSFSGGKDGGTPASALLDMGGMLYGTAEAGGDAGNGTLFAINPGTGAETTLLAFDYQNGSAPASALIGLQGVLYGTAELGGPPGFGTVFAFDTAAGQVRTLHDFAGVDNSSSSAVIKVGAALYGTASGGGRYGLGSIYRVDPHSATGRTVYSFGADGDGVLPFAALLDVNGTMYGTTRNGGAAGQGTVFRFDEATHSLTTLYSFTGGADGGYIYGGLIDVGGLLYGTAYDGGANGVGTVFSIDPDSGAETTVYTFAGGKDGALPYSGVIYANGFLYGTTLSGGAGKDGTVFQIDLATGAESVVYAFKGGADGGDPIGTVLYESGALYGTTAGFGRKSAHGTVFRIDLASGRETVLHTFDSFSGPEAALVKLGGALYGTITSTDVQCCGSIFRINAKSGAFTTLYNFTGGADGGLPMAALLDVGGKLYGTTSAITPANMGTVFRLDR